MQKCDVKVDFTGPRSYAMHYTQKSGKYLLYLACLIESNQSWSITVQIGLGYSKICIARLTIHILSSTFHLFCICGF